MRAFLVLISLSVLLGITGPVFSGLAMALDGCTWGYTDPERFRSNDNDSVPSGERRDRETGSEEKSVRPAIAEKPGIFPEGEGGERVDGEKDPQTYNDPRVRAIAGRLLENEDDGALRNAFVHGSDELDDLAAPIQFKDAVDHYIIFFTTRKREMFSSWLRRSRQYAPRLESILREHGLPQDLVYLAMIESGFNPKAYSRANACGPWQFISATGQRYGLRIDHWVDERRDFEKATVAAARYLKDLFDRFGCWYLAASGYNAGEGRIERAMKRHDTSDYWELYQYNTLPRETRAYIPQLIAAATIAENPEKYGFSETDPEEPSRYCTKIVPGGTPLHLVAEVSLSDLSEIRNLNPELMTRITPPGADQYALKLPGDASLERFDEKLKTRLKGNRVVATVRLTSHRRRSLSKLLKQYGATRHDLNLVNRGNISYIPLFDRKKKMVKEDKTVRVASLKRKKGKVTVRPSSARRNPTVTIRTFRGKATLQFKSPKKKPHAIATRGGVVKHRKTIVKPKIRKKAPRSISHKQIW